MIIVIFLKIQPLHKKGDKSNVQYYRGTTLLSTLIKLFTRILNNILTSWAEDYGIHVYIEAQAGFRKHMRTVDNNFVLNSLISLNSGKKLYCGFVDFSKSKRKAMNRNWSNQKANPALKTKTEK